MGAVNIDLEASARRLETAFPLHTEEGLRGFLEKLSNLEELKYTTGDYELTVWIVDFYDVLMEVALSPSERRIIYFLYYEGYKQSELVTLLGLKKNTIHTLLTRAIKKLASHYEWIREGEKLHG